MRAGDTQVVVSREDRATLLRKYRLLAIWRQHKDNAGARAETGETRPDAHRRELRALAQEFPGALRELDVLGLAEISQRITQLERAARPAAKATDATAGKSRTGHDDEGAEGSDQRWMAWILAYHGLMRAALTIKRRAGPTRRLSAAVLAETLGRARATCVLPIDESFARAVIRPAGGRLTVVVLAALADHFQASATEISRTLFPPRRPAPYVLSS